MTNRQHPRFYVFIRLLVSSRFDHAKADHATAGGTITDKLWRDDFSSRLTER